MLNQRLLGSMTVASHLKSCPQPSSFILPQPRQRTLSASLASFRRGRQIKHFSKLSTMNVRPYAESTFLMLNQRQ